MCPSAEQAGTGGCRDGSLAEQDRQFRDPTSRGASYAEAERRASAVRAGDVPAPEVPDAISPRTPRLPGHELVAAISQLDQAIHNHQQWHENLIRVLVTRLSPEVSDLRPDAHRRCRFGQWYDSGAGVELHNQPAFIAVGEAHQRMHTSATRLLGRVADALPISPGDSIISPTRSISCGSSWIRCDATLP